MTKHHWRQQIKSFFETHADPHKHELLKQSRKEMEEKKEKIIKLIKSEQGDGSNGKTEPLEELVEDYHKQYESLYQEYHNLTGEMNKNVYSKDGEKAKSSSDSDSDIDSSSKGRVTNELQRKLEAANHEIDDLRKKLATAEDGKEAAKSECTTSLDKLQGAEKTIRDLIILQIARFLVSDFDILLAFSSSYKRIMELEESTLNKENECLALRSKLQIGETEASSRITALNMEIGVLKEELEPMRAGKTRFESKLETMGKLENENAELRSKVVDLELNLRSAERKADDLSRGNQSHDQLVVGLQTTIEDLKRDIEMDKDELTTIEEKNRNLEVMLRLSNQKLRVTEQLLNEKEAGHKGLEDRNTTLSQTLGEYNGMIRGISEQLTTSLAELEQAITDRFNQDYGGLAKRVGAISKEVRSVKNRVAEIRSEKDVSSLTVLLEKVQEEGVVMRKTIEKLEEEASEARVEKDETILSLGEEKREAIRQLCAWTEYYRNRCAELRGVSYSC